VVDVAGVIVEMGHRQPQVGANERARQFGNLS
jgi:hypothetical protein